MVTNYIKGASYKEVYDLHTDSQCASILTVHAPVTNLPRQMLGGFFDQYRRFKYRGVRIKLRPASRLPADPLQISYEAGEPTIDPRDMLNPILARGYCGDSLGTFLNYFNHPGVQQEVFQPAVGDDRQRYFGYGFVGSSLDRTSFPEVTDPGSLRDYRAMYLEKLYYQSLSDPYFTKIPMQRGYSRFMKPLVYELATTVQKLAVDNPHMGLVDKNPTSDAASTVVNALKTQNDREYSSSNMSDRGSDVTTDGKSFVNSDERITYATTYTGNIASATNQVRAYKHVAPILTSHKRRLGWLDTDTVVGGQPTDTDGNPVENGGVIDTFGSAYNNYNPVFEDLDNVTSGSNSPLMHDPVLPPINMMALILPRAYKTEMYYRLELTHVFDFKDFRPLKGLVSPFDESAIQGASLEWADWDSKLLLELGPSVTSTAKNFKLIDVLPSDLGDVPADVGA